MNAPQSPSEYVNSDSREETCNTLPEFNDTKTTELGIIL